VLAAQHQPTQLNIKHFDVHPEFATPMAGTAGNAKKTGKPQLVGYLGHYEMLCRRMMQERLYDRACVMASPRSAVEDGAYADLSDTYGALWRAWLGTWRPGRRSVKSSWKRAGPMAI
jgi:hypothetical protein